MHASDHHFIAQTSEFRRLLPWCYRRQKLHYCCTAVTPQQVTPSLWYYRKIHWENPWY